jgi:hypothetical protein
MVADGPDEMTANAGPGMLPATKLDVARTRNQPAVGVFGYKSPRRSRLWLLAHASCPRRWSSPVSH